MSATSPQNLDVDDGEPEGVHIDEEYLIRLHDELQSLRDEVLSKKIDAIFQRWSCMCDCDGDRDPEEGAYSDVDVEDLVYCWNGDHKDKRTCHALESVLPIMESTLAKYVDLVNRTKERAAASRRKYDIKKAKKARIERLMTEVYDADSESEVDSDAMSLDIALSGGHDADSMEISSSSSPRTGLLDLPQELLSDILLIAQRDDYLLPLSFSHVNSAARQFTIDTPRLWSFISIFQSPDHIKFHLTRSLDTPLDVWLLSTYDWFQLGQTRKNTLERFLANLSPHQHRIRSLHMDIDQIGLEIRELLYGFLFNSNFTIIDVLDVGLPAAFENGTGILSVEHGEKGWPVRDLCLRSLQIPSSSQFFSANLARLEFRGCCDISGPEMVAILNKTPHLRQLRFQDFDMLNSGEAYPPAAPLQDLEVLSFMRVTTYHMAEIVSHLNTPALKNLIFMYRRQRDRELRDPAEHPLLTAAKSNPHLESLDATQADLSAGEWSQLFQSLPDLRYLRIAWSMLEDAHLAPLYNDPITFCPKFTGITLDAELFLTTAVLRRIVEARQHGPVPIRSMELRGWDFSNVDEEDAAVLQSLVPDFMLEVFVPEYDPVHQEGGFSEDMGWSDREVAEDDEEASEDED